MLKSTIFLEMNEYLRTLQKKNNMVDVKAKKHLGQHFLTNEDVAMKIVDSLPKDTTSALEIGAGMGVLTKYLTKIPNLNLKVVEIDDESVTYLIKNKILDKDQIYNGDFLRIAPTTYFESTFSIIGNFPYNISTQILFKVLEHKNQIPCVVGMFQKEVAQRVASGPGNRDYGIISVLLQAFYDIEYLFTVQEHDFNPPPRVKSGVIRLTRNTVEKLDCDEKAFIRVVKLAFNQRRKMLRNSLRSVLTEELLPLEIFNKRPEQLNVQEFIELTNMISNLPGF
jgi:16S rRNA (adenine1518-N6/adenine1519-N6)-dimethyltransferase